MYFIRKIQATCIGKIKLLTIMLLVFMINSCSSLNSELDSREFKFRQVQQEVASINEHLKVENTSDTFSEQKEFSIRLKISNESEEVLVLPDILADLRIYRYVDGINQWEEGFLYVMTFPDEIPLVPNADFSGDSFHEIRIGLDEIDIQDEDEWLRFFVISSGQQSKEQHGAFIDIFIKED